MRGGSPHRAVPSRRRRSDPRRARRPQPSPAGAQQAYHAAARDRTQLGVARPARRASSPRGSERPPHRRRAGSAARPRCKSAISLTNDRPTGASPSPAAPAMNFSNTCPRQSRCPDWGRGRGRRAARVPRPRSSTRARREVDALSARLATLQRKRRDDHRGVLAGDARRPGRAPAVGVALATTSATCRAFGAAASRLRRGSARQLHHPVDRSWIRWVSRAMLATASTIAAVGSCAAGAAGASEPDRASSSARSRRRSCGRRARQHLVEGAPGARAPPERGRGLPGRT